ncbi:hypothetical protein EYF80_033144 [Liparis tanakae]|uniref:Uncharacterized protein n=1 Tax=Liparis tanakae TaxID=230148 RepID=A0A4Z2GSN3_9TELE|nr:hypothetical protein EYF80_033144 [Liparis tanakae]
MIHWDLVKTLSMLEHKYGNRHTFPRPTAKPTQDIMKSICRVHVSRSGYPGPGAGTAFLSGPPQAPAAPPGPDPGASGARLPLEAAGVYAPPPLDRRRGFFFVSSRRTREQEDGRVCFSITG